MRVPFLLVGVMEELDTDLRTRLNGETAKIGWGELERHFARGVVIAVASALDLIDVAVAMAEDDTAALAAWMRSGQVMRADAERAQRWVAEQPLFWAVVVAPWVLVQEHAPEGER